MICFFFFKSILYIWPLKNDVRFWHSWIFGPSFSGHVRLSRVHAICTSLSQSWHVRPRLNPCNSSRPIHNTMYLRIYIYTWTSSTDTIPFAVHTFPLYTHMHKCTYVYTVQYTILYVKLYYKERQKRLGRVGGRQEEGTTGEGIGRAIWFDAKVSGRQRFIVRAARISWLVRRNGFESVGSRAADLGRVSVTYIHGINLHYTFHLCMLYVHKRIIFFNFSTANEK